MITFIFLNSTKKSFLKFPEEDQQRILNKLRSLKTHPDIFNILKKIEALPPATHRLRIGKHRLLLELAKKQKNELEFEILKIALHKDIYQ